VDEEVTPPEPGPDTAPEEIAAGDGEPGEWVGAVLRELAELRTEVGREHDRAAARELTIDRLHDDNQRLRAGERALLLRPLLTDLQRLRHEMVRTAAGLPEQFSGAQAAGLLRSYAEDLELTLERGGVAVVCPEAGVAFDPSRHRAAGTVPAIEPEQDATVAEVLLDGYHDVQTGRTVTPAAVRVHRWVPADPAPAATPAVPDEAHQPS
jgi:molecular chaperone GrpE (heat shock protein)